MEKQFKKIEEFNSKYQEILELKNEIDKIQFIANEIANKDLDLSLDLSFDVEEEKFSKEEIEFQNINDNLTRVFGNSFMYMSTPTNKKSITNKESYNTRINNREALLILEIIIKERTNRLNTLLKNLNKEFDGICGRLQGEI